MALEMLNTREQRKLEEVVAGTGEAKALRRAQALLWLHEGTRAREASERVVVSRRTLYNWAARFQERSDLEIEARLLDGSRRGRPPTALGIIDPVIDAVIDQDPREWGYRATVWTAPLLQHYLAEEHGIEVSRQSVSSALGRLRIRWKRPRHQLARRGTTWR